MDDKNTKNNETDSQKDTGNSKKSDVTNEKNYDYLEPGDVYNFEVGM